jgi:3-oxoacyl-[acyl-carrier-protein] synthase III
MQYTNVYIGAIGYELAPHVVTTEDIEARLVSVYQRLHFQKGQLAALTGIHERRFWDPGQPMFLGAIRAGQKAMDAARIGPETIGTLIYAGVCRDQLEPATACAVANGLGLRPESLLYDLSNACLGALNGILQIANAIELGQIRAGLVVCCESSRQIVDMTIDRLCESADMPTFKKTVATLTGGSGAAAVLVVDGSLTGTGHRLIGAAARNASAYHRLCLWGPDTGMPASAPMVMETDSVAVLKHGVALGIETYEDFRQTMNWPREAPDKTICHQVGSAHQKTILEALGISPEKDFVTYPFLGNIGTVSLPITAAIAEQREFLSPGDRVGFFGIGSGLNCMMLGLEW